MNITNWRFNFAKSREPETRGPPFARCRAILRVASLWQSIHDVSKELSHGGGHKFFETEQNQYAMFNHVNSVQNYKYCQYMQQWQVNPYTNLGQPESLCIFFIGVAMLREILILISFFQNEFSFQYKNMALHMHCNDVL